MCISSSYSYVATKVTRTSASDLGKLSSFEQLQKNAFRNASEVLTTFYNAADKTLSRLFESYWIIGNEVGVTRESKFFIQIGFNIDSIEKLLGVNDAQQLSSIMKTFNKSRSNGIIINEFADSQIQPLT